MTRQLTRTDYGYGYNDIPLTDSERTERRVQPEGAARADVCAAPPLAYAAEQPQALSPAEEKSAAGFALLFVSVACVGAGLALFALVFKLAHGGG